MVRHKDEIDKEYAELCTKYGDLSQKLIHLAEQEKQAEAHFEEQKENIRMEFAKARGQIGPEIRKIEHRWKELQVEIQSTVSQGNS